MSLSHRTTTLGIIRNNPLTHTHHFHIFSWYWATIYNPSISKASFTLIMAQCLRQFGHAFSFAWLEAKRSLHNQWKEAPLLFLEKQSANSILFLIIFNEKAGLALQTSCKESVDIGKTSIFKDKIYIFIEDPYCHHNYAF